MTPPVFFWTSCFLGLLATEALGQLSPISLPRPGDGGPAVAAELNAPSSVAVDNSGSLYVYEAMGGAIRRIDSATGTITTLAVECRPLGPKPWPTGCFGPINHLEIDPNGNLLLSEPVYSRLSTLDLRTQRLSVIAGKGAPGPDGKVGTATQRAGLPYTFTIDNRGNILTGDADYYLRRIDPKTGTISTIAGIGSQGFAGDGGPALAAQLALPLSLAVDKAGNVYVGDATSNRIRRVDARTGKIETIAGSGRVTTTSLAAPEFSGEGGPATEARMIQPRALTFDQMGNLLFVTGARICQIERDSGTLRTIAGSDRRGFQRRRRVSNRSEA